MKRKTLALLMALVLVIGGAVGGTIAWLTAKTDKVVNTFTTSNVDITLAETTGGENKEFKMVPGYTIAKDPKVTVTAGSEKCYLFVKLDKSSNLHEFLTYEIADGWTQGDGISIPSNVWYRIVDAGGQNQVFDVLKGNQVTVKETVTKEMMNSLEDYPTLDVIAYASQYMKNNTECFTPVEAWKNVQPSGN